MKLKKFLILISVILILAGCGKKAEEAVKETAVKEKVTVPELNWTYSIEEALKTANEKNLTLLVNFTGSDWCGW